MMRSTVILVAFGAALGVSGCANDTLMSLTPQTSEPTAALPPKPKFDPACPALASRIEALRREGVVGRLEAASKGKGSNVQVKRASLAQMTELDKANAEFQTKCSTYPTVTSPAAASAPAPVKTASASDAQAAAVIAKAQAASKGKQ